MMRSGKEKSLILLSILGERAQTVLSNLSSQTAALLTSSIENSPNLPLKEKKQFLTQVLDDLDAKRFSFSSSQRGSSAPKGGSDSFMGGMSSSAGESEIQRDPTLREPSVIARKVGEQKPQIRAFFLSRLDEGLRQEILSYMSDEAIADYESRKVISMPLGDKVFAGLYEELCRKQASDDEEDSLPNRKDDFSTQFSNFF